MKAIAIIISICILTHQAYGSTKQQCISDNLHEEFASTLDIELSSDGTLVNEAKLTIHNSEANPSYGYFSVGKVTSTYNGEPVQYLNWTSGVLTGDAELPYNLVFHNKLSFNNYAIVEVIETSFGQTLFKHYTFKCPSLFPPSDFQCSAGTNEICF